MNIQHRKRRGEWAEMRFMARAAEHGLTVTKPWGDSCRYDFVVECEGCFLRIQVKSTVTRKNRVYPCMLRGATALYTKDDFDFLAAYIIPLDVWYVIPAAVAITGRQKVHLSPESPKSKYELYREAWHLLKEKRCTGHATADLCFRHGCLSRVEQEAQP